jgi:luciferase family oxidoreductase group 1
MTGLRLGVLDQSPIAQGSTGSQALHDTLDLARLTDGLGYSRYWVAEHHGGPMLAGAAPEVLIGPIAAATQHLRVGSGGVMLPHYSPVKVAEAFSILAGLFPGRIDLGLGRAAGTDPVTTFALQRDRTRAMPDDFPDQLAELLALLDDRMPADHPFAKLAELPGGPDHRPEPWLLGSSPQSGEWAAELGLPYAFADFINPRGSSIAQGYRSAFRPERGVDDPEVVVAAWILCADTQEEADRLAASSRMAMTLLRRGRLIPVPPPDQALRFLAAEGSAAGSGAARGGGRRAIVGPPERVRAEVEELAEAYGAREVLAVTITHDHQARRRSYELLAREFGLAAGTAGAAPAGAAAPAAAPAG